MGQKKINFRVYVKVIIEFPYIFWEKEKFLTAIIPKNDDENPFHAFIAQTRYNDDSAVIIGVTSGI